MQKKKTKKREHRGTRGIHFHRVPIFPSIFRFSNFYHHVELSIHSAYTYHIIKHAYMFPYHFLLFYYIYYFINQYRNKIIIDEMMVLVHISERI